MDDLKKEFGKRLAEIRKSKKIKQKELRDMINVPNVQMISGWENGHTFPSTYYLIILAKKLDISLDYLLLGKEANTSEIKIHTYKDVASYILALVNNGLFEFSGSQYDGISIGKRITTLKSTNDTIADFKLELDNLSVASKTLRPELLKQALIDLLNKYDVPFKQNK